MPSSKIAFILCSDQSFAVFWPDFVPSKLNPANSGGLNFQKDTPLHLNLDCRKHIVSICLSIGYRLVDTYCKINFRSIQLLRIALFQDNFISICPGNYFEMTQLGVTVTTSSVARHVFTTLQPIKNSHQQKAWDRLMWANVC